MRGLLTLVVTDLKLSLRNVIATFFTFAFPVLMLLLFGAMYGNAPDPRSGLGIMDCAIPGYAVALILGSAGFMGLPIELAARRQNGVIRRFRVTPLSTSALLASLVSVNLVASIAGTLVLVAVGALAWGAKLPVAPLALVPAFLLCAGSQFALGMAIAGALRSVRATLAVCMAIFYPMMFLSGGTIPVQYLPPALQKVTAFLPMSWAVTLLQDAWFGRGWDLRAVAVLLSVLALGGAVASLLLRRE